MALLLRIQSLQNAFRSNSISTATVRRAMSQLHPATGIPPPRGQFQTHQDILKTIGRGCEKYGDKFKDWNHFFVATSKMMKDDLGINVKERKWILNWKQKYRKGVDPYYIPPSKKGTKKK